MAHCNKFAAAVAARISIVRVMTAAAGLAALTPAAWAQTWSPYALWRSGGARASAPNLDNLPPQQFNVLHQDFGPFPPREIDFNAARGDIASGGLASGSYFHSSSLEGDVLRTRGNAVATAWSAPGIRTQASGGGGLVMGFTVTEPTAFTIRGTLSLDAGSLNPALSTGQSVVYLYRIVDGNADYLVNEFYQDIQRATTLNFAGVLVPGDYRFATSTSLGLTADGPLLQEGSGAYDVTLTLPAPGGTVLLSAGAACLLRRRRGR
jgi:hypothetical protein